MDDLFVRPDGSPMQFYLADLDANMKRNYMLQVEDFGGKVEEIPNEKVLIFTTPYESFKYEFVFDVKFIDDCIQQQKILNINSYYLGDLRFNRGCTMSKMALKTSQCLCCSISYESICKSMRNQTSQINKKDNQRSKVKSVPVSRKNTKEELNIEKSNRLKQAVLKMIDSNSDNIQNEQNETNIIAETDSETEFVEVPRSPILKANSQARKGKRKVIFQESKNFKKVEHREIIKLSKQSITKNKTTEDKIIVLSSDNEGDSNNELQKGTQTELDKNKRKKPEKDKNSGSEAEDKDDSMETEKVSDEVQKFVEETLKGKKIDEHGNPHSYSRNFEPWEAQAMIKYLLISGKVHEAKELATWKEAVKLKFLSRKRTANVMQNYLKRVILPNIQSYNLQEGDLTKFKVLGPPRKVLEEV